MNSSSATPSSSSSVFEDDESETFDSFDTLWCSMRLLQRNPRKWQRAYQVQRGSPLHASLAAPGRKFVVPERLIAYPEPASSSSSSVDGQVSSRDQLAKSSQRPRLPTSIRINPPKPPAGGSTVKKIILPPSSSRRSNGALQDPSDDDEPSDASNYNPGSRGGVKRKKTRQPPGAPTPKKSRGVPPTDESDAAAKTKGEGGKDKVSHDPFERFGVADRGGYLAICEALEHFKAQPPDAAAVKAALVEANNMVDRKGRLSVPSTVALILAIRHNEAGKVKKCPIEWCGRTPDSAVMRHFLGVHSPLHSHCIALNRGKPCDAFISTVRPDTIRRHLIERHSWTEAMLAQHGLGLGTGEHTIRRLFGCSIKH